MSVRDPNNGTTESWSPLRSFNIKQSEINKKVMYLSNDTGDFPLRVSIYPTLKLPENPYWDMVLDYSFENWKDVDVTISVTVV